MYVGAHTKLRQAARPAIAMREMCAQKSQNTDAATNMAADSEFPVILATLDWSA
jgi:hypothetical protein